VSCLGEEVLIHHEEFFILSFLNDDVWRVLQFFSSRDVFLYGLRLSDRLLYGLWFMKVMRPYTV
jgi:hypothetical protein